MTLKEAVQDFQYDVNIYYYVDEEEEGWCWEVNGGYCQQWSKAFPSAAEAQDSLITFLKNFTGFDK
jgi:hypothetical protein